jgi:hypothetical protein
MSPRVTGTPAHDHPDWPQALKAVRPLLRLAPPAFVAEAAASGLADAVRAHHTPTLLDRFLAALALQGIGDHAAIVFQDRAGRPRYHAILRDLDRGPSCPRLRGFWTFDGCRYRRGQASCAEPRHLARCLVPRIPARKGALAVGAAALVLFVRDVADGDIVAWIDDRVAAADLPGLGNKRGRAVSASVVEPLSEVTGLGPKVASMLLADFLIGADPTRERWVAAGANTVVIDTLTHAWLHRTGILRRLDADHPYGPRCYAPGGCCDVLHGLAARIDAREFDPSYPAVFPRFVQLSVWSFCAAMGWNVCNGNRINDRHPCRLRDCPVGPVCDRLALKPDV